MLLSSSFLKDQKYDIKIENKLLSFTFWLADGSRSFLHKPLKPNNTLGIVIALAFIKYGYFSIVYSKIDFHFFF